MRCIWFHLPIEHGDFPWIFYITRGYNSCVFVQIQQLQGKDYPHGVVGDFIMNLIPDVSSCSLTFS